NDVDGNLAQTQLFVSSGTINVTLSGSATISAGSNGSNTFTISGSQADINATLATLIYQGNTGFVGNDVMTVISTDSGGSPLTDIDNIIISVTSSNTAPVNTVPGSQIANEDVALNI